MTLKNLISLCVGVLLVIISYNYYIDMSNKQNQIKAEAYKLQKEKELHDQQTAELIKATTEFHRTLTQFSDSIQLANASTRIVLPTIIRDIQKIKADMELLNVPTCMFKSKTYVLAGMDLQIQSYLHWLSPRDSIAQDLVLLSKKIEADTDVFSPEEISELNIQRDNYIQNLKLLRAMISLDIEPSDKEVSLIQKFATSVIIYAAKTVDLCIESS